MKKKPSPARATLRTARRYIDNRQWFVGSNIWGVNAIAPSRYIVYSYGTHFPMYIWDETSQQWYGNSDKYSPTTSRHMSSCMPSAGVNQWFNSHDMRQIANYGMFAACAMKALGTGVDCDDE